MYTSAFTFFAPDANESLADGGAKFPETRIGHSIAPDVGGYLYIEKANFRDVFCKDVSDEDADVMFAAQKPFNSTIFGATLPVPAWKTIPSWFLVSALDQTINPDLERFYAKRMNAHTSEVQSSHVSLVSHPVEVTKVIEDAAASIKM
jgi:pimeloyl-ACP methyl ester carboxylesterase